MRFPEFRPRPPWWGADLQTLRNALRPPAALAAGESRVLKLDDGDALACTLHAAPARTDRPLAVLVHGLAGSAESAYVRATASRLLERDYPVLRVNLRGAGDSRPLCRFQYHAGRSADLREALAGLAPEELANGLVLIGYSLGANMLLKFLAEYGSELPVRAAAAVSAPIDLEVASRRMLAPRNRLYQWNLLRSMKAEALAPGAELGTDERRALASCGSIYEFDARFVAPRNGYASAEAYYRANAARRFMPEIRVPALVIHSLDDPWVPGRLYAEFPWDENPALVPLLPRGGGHVGFHAATCDPAWHDRCIELFLDEVLS